MAVNVSERKGNVKNLRSHACNATKHAYKPNLQVITINGKKVRMSAREIREMNKCAA